MIELRTDRKIKNYEKWMRIKTRLHNFGQYPLDFRVGEVYWCRIGENIGYEEDGKNNEYARPVLIIRKYGRYSFFGIPLTHQAKSNKPYYYPVEINGEVSWAIFSQCNSWDASRLASFMGKIKKGELRQLKEALARYLTF